MEFSKEALITNKFTHGIQLHKSPKNTLGPSENGEVLQAILNKLQHWSSENELIINKNKTKIIKFIKG